MTAHFPELSGVIVFNLCCRWWHFWGLPAHRICTVLRFCTACLLFLQRIKCFQLILFCSLCTLFVKSRQRAACHRK